MIDVEKVRDIAQDTRKSVVQAQKDFDRKLSKFNQDIYERV